MNEETVKDKLKDRLGLDKLEQIPSMAYAFLAIQLICQDSTNHLGKLEAIKEY